MNITISPVKIDKKTKQLSKVILQSKRHKVTLTTQNNHVHVAITGKVRKRVLTSIMAELTTFEARSVAIHIYKALCEVSSRRDTALSNLKYCNYAEVFGNPWE